ncbi:MAG: ATP-binding cassette domain-containing protein, partial [Verrucomicrobiota bacterium]
GANGSGKTTMLRLFEGSLQPTSGTIERANVLRTVYFEQARTFLDPKISLRQALCPDGDSVVYQERTIHVNSWARRFLFDEDSLQLPVGNLSGGERARVHIAQLMLQQADLLLLDEPTNDLDISTLEVLEDTLLEFAGAMVLVTHDRYLLDRVSTTVMGLDGLGGAQQFADYSQWEQAQADALAATKAAVKEAAYVEREVVKPKKKLSYKEQREFEGMEAAILSAETELERLQALMHDPVVAVDAVKLHDAYEKMQVAQAAVEQLYARWAELEAKLV